MTTLYRQCHVPRRWPRQGHRCCENYAGEFNTAGLAHASPRYIHDR